MIRGIQKRMIVCKPPSGSRFECAYFVLRNEEARAPADDREALMREVGRILAESDPKSGRRPLSRARGGIPTAILCFFFGVICGLLPLLIVLIFS